MSTLVEVKSNVIEVLHVQPSIFDWPYLRCYWRYVYNYMCVILYISYQMQRTPAGLRYVHSGLCQIHCSWSFAYFGLNIQLHVSRFLFRICGRSDARYALYFGPITTHICSFVLCQLRSWKNPMSVQFCMFRFQYSIYRISVSIADMPTLRHIYTLSHFWRFLFSLFFSLRPWNCRSETSFIFRTAVKSWNLKRMLISNLTAI